MATDEPSTLDGGRSANGVRDKPPSPAGRPSSKRCSKCGETKPLAGFHAKSTNPDGLQRWCKDCRCAAERKRLAARSPEQVAARRVYYRGWKDENRERVSNYNKRLYRENPEWRAKVLAQSTEIQRVKRAARIKMLEKIKRQVGCAACGKKRPASNLQFHHLNPSEKSFAVGMGAATKPIAEVVTEVGKCAVLCLMCHANYHRRTLDIPVRTLEKARRVLAKHAKDLPRMEAERQAKRKASRVRPKRPRATS